MRCKALALCCLLLLLTLPCAAQTGLVAHYRFDEGTGATAVDSSGYGNHAAVHGASWIQIPGGYALDFDGFDDYVNCGNGASLDIRGPITIITWVCPWGRQLDREPGIVGKGFSSYLITYYQNSQVFWYTNRGGHDTWAYMLPGVWNQVAAVFDGTYLKLYINGQYVSYALSQYPSINQGGNLYVGCTGISSGQVTGPFKGLVDEVKVFNRALSASEIASQYSGQEHNSRNEMFSQGVEDGLVAHYNFEEGSGSTLEDLSGHGNTATIRSGAWAQAPDGHALEFDGIADYVECEDTSSLNIRREITTISWVRPHDQQLANEPGILGKGFFSFLLTYQNGIAWWHIGEGANNAHYATPPGAWSEVTTTYDGTMLRLYVNGEPVAETESSYALIPQGGRFLIGCVWDDGEHPTMHFKGYVDDVKIYNRALSASEVNAHFDVTKYNLKNSEVANPQSGLVAYYRLDEGAGTLVNDSSGCFNRASIHGASWIQIPGGYALHFDGYDDYVDCGASPTLDTREAVTTIAWVCPWGKQISASETGILGKGFTSYLLTYYLNSQAWWYIEGGTSWGANNTNTSFLPGQWTQVATTFDGAWLRIYVNGQFAAENLSMYPTINQGANLLIGCTALSSGSPVAPFKGVVDEVKVYNRALSPEEIASQFDPQELALRNSMFSYGIEDSLVAHYSFDEGVGTTTFDSSGHGHIGNVSGAKWVAVNGGYALEFDGEDDFVDFGSPTSLDIRGPITMSGWVCPTGNQPDHEPAIFGKSMTSYLITYYMNRRVWWYINSGGNSANATVMPYVWSQVTVSFDGTHMKIYVNGDLVAKRPSSYTKINPGANFYVGCEYASGSRVDRPFKGIIDEIKVYNRALTDEEVMARFDPQEVYNRNSMFASECAPVTPAASFTLGNVTVKIGARGGLQVDNGTSYFVWDSSYSYPGASIGWNTISETDVRGWTPMVSKFGGNALLVAASCPQYSLVRIIRYNMGRLEVTDTLKNLGSESVGIKIAHSMYAPEGLINARYGVGAANPIIFFGQSAGDFGIVAEDDIGRLQFDSYCAANTAGIRHSNFCLEVGKSYTFKYVIYTLDPTGDIYAFVNRLRNDWNANFTIEGPWQFLDVAPGSIIYDQAALTSYLDRKQLNVIALMPWLDYDPGSMDHTMTREEYKTMMQNAASIIREVRPQTKIIGCIETDWVAIYPDQMEDGHLIATGTPAQITQVIENADLPWKDSIKRDRNGHVAIEYYWRGGRPQYALAVYPAPGNYQHQFLMEQAEFLMDEVGLDGFYIDEFSQAWGGSSIRSYGKESLGELAWDGFSVDIDPDTGQITRRHVDCGLVGINPRVEIVNTAFNRGKVVTANTYSTSRAEQVLKTWRFSETWGSMNVDVLSPGKKPPFMYELFEGQLGTMIGLGSLNGLEEPGSAKKLMLAIMCYLRHGMLYYHYVYPEIPETGPYSGEYSALNRMFPLTPVELHEGWIKGRERIVSCVSFRTQWYKNQVKVKGKPDVPIRPHTPTAVKALGPVVPPTVRFFDIYGREIPNHKPAVVRRIDNLGGWEIIVNLDDWSEFAIVE